MTKRQKIVATLLGIVVVAQLIPMPRTNPPVSGEIAAPEPVAKSLKTACYDCHSNQTVWPWYAWVAPASWLLVYDVVEGREHMNFSEFASLPADKQAHAFEEIVEVLQEGEMPPAIYTPLHPEAKLSDADRRAIIAWAQGNGG